VRICSLRWWGWHRNRGDRSSQTGTRPLKHSHVTGSKGDVGVSRRFHRRRCTSSGAIPRPGTRRTDVADPIDRERIATVSPATGSTRPPGWTHSCPGNSGRRSAASSAGSPSTRWASGPTRSGGDPTIEEGYAALRPYVILIPTTVYRFDRTTVCGRSRNDSSESVSGPSPTAGPTNGGPGKSPPRRSRCPSPTRRSRCPSYTVHHRLGGPCGTRR